MCEDKSVNQRSNGNRQQNDNGRQEINERKDYGEHRDYGHIHERVEETDSTKNPPAERE